MNSRKNILRLAVILLLGGLTILLLVKMSHLNLDQRALASLQLPFIIGAVCVHYSGFAMRGWRWQALLRSQDIKVNWRYAFGQLICGWFISALLPARAGDIYRVALLKKDHQVDFTRSLGAIATERGLDMLAIILLGGVTAAWALPGNAPAWLWQGLLIGSGLFLLAIAVLLAAPIMEKLVISLCRWRPLLTAASFIFSFLQQVRTIARKPALLAMVSLQSLYIWACDIFLTFLILKGIGLDLSLAPAAFASMASDLAVSIPFTPGGIGQFEAALLALLRLFGMGMSDAGLAVLLNRLISFWTFLIFSGIMTYISGFRQIFSGDIPAITATPSDVRPHH
jgi:uncharacterized protein (TIRG00374 family)